jgi:hypothetical protein
MKQTVLFGSSKPSKPKEPTPKLDTPYPTIVTPTVKPVVKPLIPPRPAETTEQLIQHIENEMYLWDMRAWDERTREQAEQWVAAMKAGKRDDKNCGHACYCIRQLLSINTDEKIIVDAIMRNTSIQYKNRLVRCFHGGLSSEEHPCPKYREQGNYGGGICKDCENEKKMDVARERVQLKRKLRKAGATDIKDLPTEELKRRADSGQKAGLTGEYIKAKMERIKKLEEAEKK